MVFWGEGNFLGAPMRLPLLRADRYLFLFHMLSCILPSSIKLLFKVAKPPRGILCLQEDVWPLVNPNLVTSKLHYHRAGFFLGVNCEYREWQKEGKQPHFAFAFCLKLGKPSNCL